MTYLLDTHVWLWLQADPDRVRPDLLEELADPATELLLSAASSWEIAIKWRLGKLTLPQPPSIYVPDRLRAGGVGSLVVEHHHALAVAELPPHHRDPFDRLLIAQAVAENLRLVTSDGAFDAYEVDTVMATY